MSEGNFQPDRRITIIGGGHGTAALLPEITRHLPHSAGVISMSDDSGSSRALMDTIPGINLPVGDYTRVVVASSDNEQVAQMEEMRFGTDAGGLSGHTARNISAVSFYLMYGPKIGLKRYGQAMGARGEILPVTFTPHQLVMETDGRIVRGQSAIDKYPVTGRFKIWHEPQPDLDPDAEKTILDSHAVILGPGSFRGSLLAACTDGVKRALKATGAPKILILNAENRPADPDWGVADYLASLLDHDIQVDYVITPTEEERARVRGKGRRPIENLLDRRADIPSSVKLLEANVLRTDELSARHDAQAVLQQVLGIMAIGRATRH